MLGIIPTYQAASRRVCSSNCISILFFTSFFNYGVFLCVSNPNRQITYKMTGFYLLSVKEILLHFSLPHVASFVYLERLFRKCLDLLFWGHLCNHKSNNPILCPCGICRGFSPNNFHTGTKMTGISLSPENYFLLFPISPISFTTEIKKFIKYNLL